LLLNYIAAIILGGIAIATFLNLSVMIYYTAILIKQKSKDLFNKVKELWAKWKNRKMPKTE
jgi:hypothetical protein